MKRKAKILVAEDDPDVIVFVGDQLEALGHRVITAHNGREALEKVEKHKPDLVVLDVMMPEMDGYEVCERLKSDPKTENIPILMLTAKGQLHDKVEGFQKGADDYLAKPYNKAEFEARVRVLLKRSNYPPYDNHQKDSVLSISCKPDRDLNIHFTGKTSFTAISKKELNLDVNLFAQNAANARVLGEKWRFQCTETGKQLYQKLFGDHPQAFSTYHRAVEAIENEEELHFRFESERDFLRVPLEFLFADEEYLVLKHPFARTISGVHIKKQPLSPDFLNDLCLNNEVLRILLIASNTLPSDSEDGVGQAKRDELQQQRQKLQRKLGDTLPYSPEEKEILEQLERIEKQLQFPSTYPEDDLKDNSSPQEIDILKTSIQEFFEDKGIPVRLKSIPAGEATYETVRQELKNCHYHIIHYAGYVDRETLSSLHILLRKSEVRFIYLSCCLGLAAGETAKLLDDDFLRIAEGLIQSGVPSVLGFRWTISDSGAQTLACEFYRSLAEQGQIDTALLHARCEVAMKDRDDIT